MKIIDYLCNMKTTKKIVLESIEQAKDTNKITVPVDALNKVFSKFGVSPENIETTELTEFKDDLHKFTSRDKTKKVTIRIPKSKVNEFASEIIDYTKKMGEDIVGIKNWYQNAHDFIVKELGSDAPFFLMLLGVTSKSRSVGMNLTVAKTIYTRFKQEIENNRQEVLTFVNDTNLKFGNETRIDDVPYKLSFVDIAKDISGLWSDFKNINKVLRLYFAKDGKITFDDAISWMKSFFHVQGTTQARVKTLDTDTSISGHKLYNYTMNLLDPTNEKSPDYYFVTIDRHMIKYFIPEAADESKSKMILEKVFSDTKGMYYALSLLIRDITAEINKTMPELTPNQVQAIVWFIAREKYSTQASSEGGTYEKEFNNLSKMIAADKENISDSKGKLSFADVSKYVSTNFNKALNVKTTNAAAKPEEEYPF